MCTFYGGCFHVIKIFIFDISYDQPVFSPHYFSNKIKLQFVKMVTWIGQKKIHEPDCVPITYYNAK